MNVQLFTPSPHFAAANAETIITMAEIQRDPCDDPQCIWHIDYADDLARSNPSSAVQKAVEQIRLDPESAIRAAGISQAYPEYYFIDALIKLAVIDTRIRQGGAPSLFIRLIVSGNTSGVDVQSDALIGTRRHWEAPLTGVINVMAEISRDES